MSATLTPQQCWALGIVKTAVMHNVAKEAAHYQIQQFDEYEMAKFASAIDYGTQKADEDFHTMVEQGVLHEKIAEDQQIAEAVETEAEEVVSDPEVVQTIKALGEELVKGHAAMVGDAAMADPAIQQAVVEDSLETAEHAVLNGEFATQTKVAQAEHGMDKMASETTTWDALKSFFFPHATQAHQTRKLVKQQEELVAATKALAEAKAAS